MSPRKRLASVLLASVTAIAGLGLTQMPAQAQQVAAPAVAKPATPVAVSGDQAEPAIKAGSKDKASVATKPLGATQSVKVDAATGKPVSISSRPAVVAPAFGYVTGVDFSTFYNYCQGNLVYTTVTNTTSALQYVEVQIYANGGYRTFYTSIAAGGTAYPTWYGVSGTYYAYLYVWNGSSYAYDEYRTSANNCAVSATLTLYTGYTGYVLLTLKNTGNSYASVESNELAPYPGTGTYTGLHWDYPAPYGGIVYRYLYVGTGLRFAIFADLYGATYYTPWYWYGVL
jgi:hypothetical protein